MTEENDSPGFIIPEFRWNTLSAPAKNDISGYLGLDEAKSAYYFDIYFSRFHILHKIGHIILHLFDAECGAKPGRTEYLANLFAYKYLQEKQETEYLEVLTKSFSLLTANRVDSPPLQKESIDDYFSGMQTSLHSYITAHGLILLDCMNNPLSLKEILERISARRLSVLNSSVVLQKKLEGEHLIQECLFYVFEMNNVNIGIDYREKSDLDRESLDHAMMELQHA